MASATARHILVATEDQCNELKQQITEGADFAELAKSHSQCPSGRQGGDLGRFGPGQMVPEFDKVVFSAPVNAPFSNPNISASISSLGIAAQFKATKSPFLRLS